jgi:molecular chaperone HscC
MIVGIDLGTTNSLISYWTEAGPVLIPNALGEMLTPSVVGIDDSGKVLVGKAAREYQVTCPERCASVFKRYMGTRKSWRIGDRTFLPEELSALVIRSLREDGEHHLGTGIEEAVISVPAYFSDAQRKATKRAGELAGLKVERLISEPTAAAMAYGFHERHRESCLLVFDLGGGTFDVSILEMYNNIMEVRAVAGDNFLGGEDFTELIAQHFLKSTRLAFENPDARLLSRIRKEAEQAKRRLGPGKTVEMSVTVNNDEQACTLSASQLESMAGSLLSRLKTPVERALRDSSLKLSDIDGIILVGGATKMPLIRSFVSRLFGRLPVMTIDPDQVVAMGAGLQAALKGRASSVREVILTDVCPYTLGTTVSVWKGSEYEPGHYLPVIERNTVIPVSRVERVYSLCDQQKSLRVEILQGESRLSRDNIMLGELNVPIPPGPAGQEAADIRYTYDINGILEVDITVVSSGLKRRMVIEKDPGHMSRAEIEQRLSALSHLKIHPRDQQENRWVVARCERIYEESIGRLRQEISELLSAFERVMESQDIQLIRDERRRLMEYLDRIDRKGDF